MKQKFTLFSFIIYRLTFVLIFLISNNIYACSCIETKEKLKTKVKKGFKDADLVIIGKVIEIKEVNKDTLIKSSADPVIYVFELKQIFKEEINTSFIEVVSAASSASCGYVFNLGEEYLVYARKSDFYKNTTHNKFDFTTGLCSRNQKLNILHKKEQRVLNRLKRRSLRKK